ncbi:MAG: hypothetical protein V4510_00385 [bacterium]
MADPVAQWVGFSSSFLAAALMLALAIGILLLNHRSVVTRAFAFMLFLGASIVIVHRLENASRPGGVLEASGLNSAMLELLWYLRVAYVPAMVLFLLVYVRPVPVGTFRWLRWAIAGVALVALETVLAVHFLAGDRCIAFCEAGGVRTAGPLYILTEQSGLGTALAGLAGLGFAISASRRPVGALHSAVFLLSLGFTLNALVDGADNVLLLAHGPLPAAAGAGGSAFWAWASWGLAALGFAAAAVSLVVYAIDARNHAELRRRAVTSFVMSAGALATACYIALSPPTLAAPGAALDYLSLWAIFLVGIVRLALPALAALALVKHRLFGIEVKINHGVSRSLVVGAFLAVFFVVTQIIQNLFASPGWGILGGGAAAGILLFALHPLQNLGHRIADAVIPTPHRKTTRVSKHEALDIYRDQALLVWADGVMGRKERALLDQLRDRLAVPLADAARIEREAADAAPAGKFPRRKPRSRSAQLSPD